MTSVTYNFQDASGEPLEFGSVTFTLNTDAMAGDSQICAGRVNLFLLDGSGSFTGMIWKNSDLTPAGTTYRVKAYTSEGQLAFEQDMTV